MEETTPSSNKLEGLSTNLLIYIVIGLISVLIGLAVIWFINSNDENGIQHAELESQDPIAEIDSVSIDTIETKAGTDIELPVIAEEIPSSVTPSTALSPTVTPPNLNPADNSTTSTNASNLLLSEIMDLQKQLAQARADNQSLIKQVQHLTEQNKHLQSRQNVINEKKSPDRHAMPLSHIVRDDSIKSSSSNANRQAPPSPPPIKLAPKWGNLDLSD